MNSVNVYWNLDEQNKKCWRMFKLMCQYCDCVSGISKCCNLQYFLVFFKIESLMISVLIRYVEGVCDGK